MTRGVQLFGLCTALGALVASGSSAAIAAASANGVVKPVGSAPQIPTVIPSGYKIVRSAWMTSANGLRTFGYVSCPPTSSGVARYPQGGGVVVASFNVLANVSSSYPNGINWQVDVNNASGTDTTFQVYAVCAKPRTNYQAVPSVSITNPAGAQTGGFQKCPTGTKVLGGGAIDGSGDLTTNINSSYPTSNGWHVDMNNGSATSTHFTVWVVCSSYSATKQNYGVHVGTSVDNPAGVQTLASVACPSGQSSLGGGVYSNSSSTAVNLNSSYPVTGGWDDFESNASIGDQSITPYVVCAT
jgi:hypothetical protein